MPTHAWLLQLKIDLLFKTDLSFFPSYIYFHIKQSEWSTDFFWKYYWSNISTIQLPPKKNKSLQCRIFTRAEVCNLICKWAKSITKGEANSQKTYRECVYVHSYWWTNGTSNRSYRSPLNMCHQKQSTWCCTYGWSGDGCLIDCHIPTPRSA